MPDWLPLLGPSLISFGAAVTVGVMVYKSTRKGDATTATLTERRDTIADRDSLINQLQEDISGLKTDMASQKVETAELRSEVREVREHNIALIRYAYRLIDILRSVGHGDKIPTPPPNGIHL